jgi:uncharacterized membrane protein YdbT with pleckstrin-like domain
MTQALAKTNIVAIESANSAQPARALSMTRSAVRSRERNAEKKAAALSLAQAEQEAQAAAEKAAREEAQAAEEVARVKMQAAMRKAGAGRIAAAIAAAFLPIASFVLAHIEAPTNPALWVLVAAALLFSAPTLVQWAAKWCGSMYKAMGFTILLEGCQTFSTVPGLYYGALAILVGINCLNAYSLAGRAQALDM